MSLVRNPYCFCCGTQFRTTDPDAAACPGCEGCLADARAEGAAAYQRSLAVCAYSQEHVIQLMETAKVEGAAELEAVKAKLAETEKERLRLFNLCGGYREDVRKALHGEWGHGRAWVQYIADIERLRAQVDSAARGAMEGASKAPEGPTCGGSIGPNGCCSKCGRLPPDPPAARELGMRQMTDAERESYQRFVESQFQPLGPDARESVLKLLQRLRITAPAHQRDDIAEAIRALGGEP